MAKPKKIALIGKMRSGKDTVADILVEEYGYTPYRFSAGISQLIQDYFPGAKESNKDAKLRKYYQHIGQELRVLNKNVWVDYTFRQMDSEQKEFQLVTDVRQENEYIRLLERGFVFIKIVTDDAVRKERILSLGEEYDEKLFEHETETVVDTLPSDYITHNNGTLSDLHKAIRQIEKIHISERRVLCD